MDFFIQNHLFRKQYNKDPFVKPARAERQAITFELRSVLLYYIYLFRNVSI
jgi:hypothetical protein